MRGSGNATMNDVAREAQVALRTVSRYVNGETNINPQLADRIASAISLLGYRRNLAAAALRLGQPTKTLGLIISDLANPYYSALTRAIESYASERGYLLFSSSSDEDGGRHDDLVDRMMQQQVEGLFVVPPASAGRDWRALRPPIPPVIFLDRPAAFATSTTILADNAGGAYSATWQLVHEGAHKVAFVGEHRSLYTMQERYRGYEDALNKAGMAVDESVVITHAHSSEEAAEAVERLLETSEVDAIFAANNRASIGALMAFRKQGRRVRLIGFDDFEGAQLADPQVSVVNQDVALMGRTAAQLMLARLGRPENLLGGSEGFGLLAIPEIGGVTLSTRLILRGSERM
jgi:LacI family transcriptional regulator